MCHGRGQNWTLICVVMVLTRLLSSLRTQLLQQQQRIVAPALYPLCFSKSRMQQQLDVSSPGFLNNWDSNEALELEPAIVGVGGTESQVSVLDDLVSSIWFAAPKHKVRAASDESAAGH